MNRRREKNKYEKMNNIRVRYQFKLLVRFVSKASLTQIRRKVYKLLF